MYLSTVVETYRYGSTMILIFIMISQIAGALQAGVPRDDRPRRTRWRTDVGASVQSRVTVARGRSLLPVARETRWDALHPARIHAPLASRGVPRVEQGDTL